MIGLGNWAVSAAVRASVSSGDNGAVSDAEDQSAGSAPSTGAHGRRGHRRVVRRGTEREAVPGVSADERPAGWGDGGGGEPGSADAGHDSNDEQLRRDVPPHWG